MAPDSRLLPYATALIVGVTVGGLGHSAILAGAVACGVSVVWALSNRRA
jgi:hypothetical protein